MDPSDERKYRSERDTLERYADLEKSCLTDIEKKQVMEILYKYKGAFSLRDEIGTYPNMEIENIWDTQITIFISLYQLKEEDKHFIDKEMKQLCYL